MALVEYLAVGKILSPWGIKGQVKVKPLTDDIRRFEVLDAVYIDSEKDVIYKKIEKVTFLKQNFVVLKFEEIDTIETAEKLRNCFIKIHRDDAIELPENHFFICDIIGLCVYDEEQHLIGKIKDVIQTGANDVYVIKTRENKEVLLPAIKQVVKEVDIINKKMTINPLEGML